MSATFPAVKMDAEKKRARQHGGGEVALTDAEVGLILGISRVAVYRIRKADVTFPRPVALLHPDGLKRTDRSAVIAWWKKRHRAAQVAS
jgi:predicted DNA-binding transcriptional regulator AlpA